MAIYRTFFLCKPDELQNGFPDWKPPLPHPVSRQFKNPFTRKVQMIETRAPEWPEEAATTSPIRRDFRVVSVGGNYADYLEGRLPRFVQDRAHWASKGLTNLELDELAASVNVNAKLESALYSPPSSGAVLVEIPLEVSTRLLALDGEGLAEVAGRWSARMSEPDHTHSLSGRRVEPDWTAADATEILRALVALARRGDNVRMYLLIEA
jgi:hypothetical protein